eukprot:TRINITY_DN761_c0_g1_i1.p1 TRINITY_DN761_c0_g1~~TRINITY_DN761_c0_g1_i1.p1  ORF type:complete len:613 (-),score=68.06 TRINITY_DN761_c0_g1_i1:15-1853(-)
MDNPMGGEVVFFVILLSCGLLSVAFAHRLAPSDVSMEAAFGTVTTLWSAGIFICLLPYNTWTASVSMWNPFETLSRTFFWVSSVCSWMVCPFLIECGRAGEFTMLGMFGASLRRNAVYYSACMVCLSTALLWIVAHGGTLTSLPSWYIAAVNSLGLFSACFLVGFGLWAVPLHIWRWTDHCFHLKALYASAIQVNEAKLIAQLKLQDTIYVARAEVASRLKEMLDEKLEKAYDMLQFTLDECELILCEVADGDGSHTARQSNQACPVAHGKEDVTRLVCLSQLHHALKQAGYQACREGCQWRALVSRCMFLEDLEQDVVPSVMEMVSSWHGRFGGFLARQRPVRKVCHWVLVLWLRKFRRVLFRFLSCVCAILSLAILIGQLTLPLNTRPLSALQFLFHAENGFFFTQALCIILLVYMLGTTFWSLRWLNLTGRHGGLFAQRTDAASLLWYSSMFAWLAVSLCFHIRRIIPVKGTILQDLMGPVEAELPLVFFFSRWCPLLSCCLFVCHLFGKYSKLVRSVGLEVLEFNVAILDNTKTNGDVLEGRRLFEFERMRRSEKRDLLETKCAAEADEAAEAEEAAEEDEAAKCVPLRCQINRMIEDGTLPSAWVHE